MNSRKRDIRWVIVAILGAAAAWIAIWPLPLPQLGDESGRQPRSPALPRVAPPAESPGPAAPAEKQVAIEPAPPGAPERPALDRWTPPISPDPSDRSPLADRLHAPERTGMQDVRVVLDLLKRYRESFGAFPTGEDNPEIVNALSGNNPAHLAILPPDHPAIDAEGRLVDRWRRPFFFHILSRESIEVRSAGPDGEMWTPDDEVLGSQP